MPERTPREVASDLAIHRTQMVHTVKELEDIVRYWLDTPRRVKQVLRTVRPAPSAYLVLGAGVLVFCLGALLARRR
jgi:hypothetical protein